MTFSYRLVTQNNLLIANCISEQELRCRAHCSFKFHRQQQRHDIVARSSLCNVKKNISYGIHTRKSPTKLVVVKLKDLLQKYVWLIKCRWMNTLHLVYSFHVRVFPSFIRSFRYCFATLVFVPYSSTSASFVISQERAKPELSQTAQEKENIKDCPAGLTMQTPNSICIVTSQMRAH